jgi:Mg2+/Co2+ transporter CorB
MEPVFVLAAAGTVVVLLAASAFFSSSETAVFSLGDEGVAAAAERDPRGRTLADLYADPHRLLVTLLVGNNVVNVALSSVVAVSVSSVLPAGQAVVATTLLTSFLVLVFGEIVPKSYGLANAERWSLTVAGPVRTVERALAPVIAFFDWVTRRMNALVPVDSDIEAPYID